MEAKKRKPNWTDDEIMALAEGVRERIEIIKGKFSPLITAEKKNRSWAEVAEKVNAVNNSGQSRDVAEVRKKWQDVNSITKKKEAERRRALKLTGGGPAVEDSVKNWEMIIISTLSDSCVEGIGGGIDTAEIVPEKENTLPTVTTSVMPSTSTTTGDSCTDIHILSERNSSADKCNKSEMLSNSSSIDIKKNRKRPLHYEVQDVQHKFLRHEKEKDEKTEMYRTKKLSLLEKIITQQNEMLDLQRRTTVALELIAVNSSNHANAFNHNYNNSPISVSPFINFQNLS